MNSIEAFLNLIYLSNILFLGLNVILFSANHYRKMKNDAQEKEFSDRYHDILEKANKESARILEKATQKSEKVLLHSNYIKNDIEKKLNIQLESLKDQNSQILVDQLNKFQDQNSKFLDQFRSNFEHEVGEKINLVTESGLREIEQAVGNFKRNSSRSSEEIEKKIEEEFKKSLIEIESYKNKQLGRIESSIEKILLSAAKNILSGSINLEIDEGLIFESLEKAKAEGYFDEKLS